MTSQQLGDSVSRNASWQGWTALAWLVAEDTSPANISNKPGLYRKYKIYNLVQADCVANAIPAFTPDQNYALHQFSNTHK